METKIEKIGTTHTIVTIFDNKEEKACLQFDFDHDANAAIITDLVSFDKGKGYAKAVIIETVKHIEQRFGSEWLISNNRTCKEICGFYSHLLGEKITKKGIIAYTIDEDGSIIRNSEIENNL